MIKDPLNHFLDAQQRDYVIALTEIKSGRKRSHWMWYIFPQIAGLGFSAMSKKYAIAGLPEAVDFLMYPVLGERLVRISTALLELEQIMRARLWVALIISNSARP